MKPSRVITKHTIRSIRKSVQKAKETYEVPSTKETLEDLQRRRSLTKKNKLEIFRPYYI